MQTYIHLRTYWETSNPVIIMLPWWLRASTAHQKAFCKNAQPASVRCRSERVWDFPTSILKLDVQDKTVSQIQAKDRILEYLKHKPSITNQKAQELCGFNKNQTYYILHQMCKDGILQPDGVGRGTKYKSVK